MRAFKTVLFGTAALSAAFVLWEGFATRALAQEGAPALSSSEYLQLTGPLPAKDQKYQVIDGHQIWQYVKEQTDIAERYRDAGHPQFWGRIDGTSADVEDANWELGKFRQFGLSDAHLQTVNMFLPQWSAHSWSVSAAASGKTVHLTSAQPPYGSVDTGGKELDLEVVFVGVGSEADFAGRDVRGKAVLYMQSQVTYTLGPADVLKRAQQHGAAAILGTDMRGGNYNEQPYRAYTNVPTFKLGTQDGETLRDMIGAVAAGDPPHVRIGLDAEWVPQKTFMVWGTLPGMTDETIYVIAHRDGWFNAAGDNASGTASMLGLAEYFSKVPKSQRQRTIVFIGTDGHHNNAPGAYGSEWLVANRDKIFAKTALFINDEHPAEALTHGVGTGSSGVTGGSTDTTIPDQWYGGGPSRPQLEKIAADAFREFGLPIWSQPGARPPGGDMGKFYWFLPAVIAQSDDFAFMHTTGDTADNVPWTGLEAATRACAKIIDEVNKIPLKDLQQPPSARPNATLDLTNCADWIKDSANSCNSQQNYKGGG